MRLAALERWRPAKGAWNRAAAAHLFRRAGFGALPAEVELALANGFEVTLEDLLARDEHDPRLVQGIEALLPAGSTDQLAAWWMSLLLTNGAPLRERVTLLWHDHFATSDRKVEDARSMHRQNTLFREQGLGDFRALLHGIAKDPAMLVWLDGNSNRVGHPNENFAREVLELFALGIGNYTERDVQEAARAFTGWGTSGRSFVFREQDHDSGAKTLLAREGLERGEEALDALLDHPACPRFVARKLLEEFVAPAPLESWIEETACVLVERDWNVRATLEVVLASELFFSSAARRSRIAGPVELVATSIRTLGARTAPSRAAEAARAMGQSLFRPPSVKGWDGMRAWINAGTWVARHNFLVRLAESHLGSRDGTTVDLRAAFSEVSSPAEVPKAVLSVLVPDLDPADLTPTLQRAAQEAEDLDRALVLVSSLVLASPEFQLL